jgi:hypothetical protein
MHGRPWILDVFSYAFVALKICNTILRFIYFIKKLYVHLDICMFVCAHFYWEEFVFLYVHILIEKDLYISMCTCPFGKNLYICMCTYLSMYSLCQ